tara:strand:+ start:3872 stop:4060 length:189 start_codon:yes stop_codon:yes gene_type:complete
MKTNKLHPKYWDFHKEIYFKELDSLDHEIREIVIDKPESNTAIRFNDKVDRLIQDQIVKSDS